MELEYIKELLGDIAAAEGKTYEEFALSNGTTAEEINAMIYKGMQMDVGEFEFVCKLTGMNQSTIINYCNAKSTMKRMDEAKHITDEADNLEPRSKAIFNRYMELMATDIINGDLDAEHATAEEVVAKYKEIIEKELGQS